MLQQYDVSSNGDLQQFASTAPKAYLGKELHAKPVDLCLLHHLPASAKIRDKRIHVAATW